MSNRKPSEQEICREVIDRHDVMKNQILDVINELLSDPGGNAHVDHALSQVSQIIKSQTDGLVRNISRQFMK